MKQRVSSRHESDLGGRFSPFGSTERIGVTVEIPDTVAGIASVQHTAWMLINLLARFEGVLGFIQQRHSPDGQKNNRLGRDSRAHANQRVPQLVHHNAAENNSHQGQPATSIGGAMCRGLGQPHEDQQKKECQMDTEFDSENPPCRNGPISH